eukprot:TRINITY_DN26478_c0_g1_i1.p1 TRINITY_DN26478_c0_g1~~TRINITY_DN26478_c0_g1_i1.p1  ORF type:complete len:275 (+),score=83.54 TRINITY_DN26478_c0_g1_i1:129-953(+)
MAAAASQEAEQKAARARTESRPYVNLTDIPELLPGAQPSANPAQREEFEQRCIKLHREAEMEEREATVTTQVAAGGAVTVSDLEAMFPMLDAALINCIFADSRSPQAAIDTLLALSADLNEPVDGAARPRAKSPPPRDLGVEDHEKFPSLTDGSGWQVASSKLFERDPDEELGSVWRDRAKDAAPLAAPKASLANTAWGKPRKKKENDEAANGGYIDDDKPLPETDYEFRHRVGQQRAKKRLQYGRTGRGRAPQGAEAGGDDECESEEEEDDLA